LRWLSANRPAEVASPTDSEDEFGEAPEPVLRSASTSEFIVAAAECPVGERMPCADHPC